MIHYTLTIEFDADDREWAELACNAACAALENSPSIDMGECDLDEDGE